MLFLCLKIFIIRIIDVSLGTVRTMVTVKGKNSIAALIGFIEMLIWFIVVKEAMNDSNSSILIAISYALGFATGTYIGGYISGRFIKTNLTLQVISTKYEKLIEKLRKSNYAVTVIDIEGKNDTSKMLMLQIPSSKLEAIRNIITKIDRKAFVMVDETKYVFNGYIN